MSESSPCAGTSPPAPPTVNAVLESPRFRPVQPSLDAMNGGPLRTTVTITNPMGFHFRPIAAFAQLAARFPGTVSVWKADRRANGKSPLELMTLAAEQGTELTVEVSGHDGETVLAALAELLASPGQDDETETPLPPKG